jgi:hypothetical protein
MVTNPFKAAMLLSLLFVLFWADDDSIHSSFCLFPVASAFTSTSAFVASPTTSSRIKSRQRQSRRIQPQQKQCPRGSRIAIFSSSADESLPTTRSASEPSQQQQQQRQQGQQQRPSQSNQRPTNQRPRNNNNSKKYSKRSKQQGQQQGRPSNNGSNGGGGNNLTRPSFSISKSLPVRMRHVYCPCCKTHRNPS